MTVPILIEAPASMCFSSVTMTLNTAVSSTLSPFSYDEQSFLWDGEAWTMDLTMPPVKNPDIVNDWITFELKLRGSYNYMLIGDPSKKRPRGVATGTPVINGVGQSGDLVSTSGWTAGVTGILRKGDYIQIGTGIASRLHMVTEDVNSNALGNASIPIRPALRYSPANGQAIITNNPRGVFKKTSSTASWGVAVNGFYRFNLSAGEVVNA